MLLANIELFLNICDYGIRGRQSEELNVFVNLFSFEVPGAESWFNQH